MYALYLFKRKKGKIILDQNSMCGTSTKIMSVNMQKYNTFVDEKWVIHNQNYKLQNLQKLANIHSKLRLET